MFKGYLEMKQFGVLIAIISSVVNATELELIAVQTSPTAPFYVDIEPNDLYGFTVPVLADVLANNGNYMPDYYNRYFMSIFGPRYKATNSSNIEYFDFHQGEDITADVSFGGIEFSEDNPPTIKNMCQGRVDEVNTDEQNTNGKWVRVECDRQFNVLNWGSVYISYRHMESINVVVNEMLQKNQSIGVMGKTGTTETVHLHLSVQRLHDNSLFNVHPMRIFDKGEINHLSSALISPVIEQLKYDEDSALFRIHIPFNQVNIRAVRVSQNKDDWDRLYDFEVVSQQSVNQNIDVNNFVAGIELFAYPFNRGHPMYRRFIENYESMPLAYPASHENQPRDFFPILSGRSDSGVDYVFDVKATDLPTNYDIRNLFIEIYDIWGNGYRAYGVKKLNTHQSFDVASSQDDAEENKNGEVSVFNANLNVGDVGIEGNRLVGLQFHVATIPEEVLVTSAYIQLTADKINAEETGLQIYMENSYLPTTFTEENNNISNRETDQFYQNWSVAPWGKVDDSKNEQKTPNLSNLINQHINSSDWPLGNKLLSFIISGTGIRVADSADNFYKFKSPNLYIEYIMLSEDVIYKYGFD